MFWDLGGPVFEFDGPLKTPGQGHGRLLSRAAFLALAGLNPLTADEAAAFSHYVVHRRDGQHAVALTDEDCEWWLRNEPLPEQKVLRLRMDGSIMAEQL